MYDIAELGDSEAESQSDTFRKLRELVKCSAKLDVEGRLNRCKITNEMIALGYDSMLKYDEIKVVIKECYKKHYCEGRLSNREYLVDENVVVTYNDMFQISQTTNFASGKKFYILMSNCILVIFSYCMYWLGRDAMILKNMWITSEKAFKSFMDQLRKVFK